jgi:hypothetical protein
MSNQDFQHRGPQGGRGDDGLAQRTAKAAGDAYSAVSDLTGDAADKAKQAAGGAHPDPNYPSDQA